MILENNKILSALKEQISYELEWPTKVDVSGCAFSLFTIQYTYRVPVINLAQGIFGKRKTSARLSVEEIEQIVNNRLEDDSTISHFPGKDYALAIEWVEEALRYKNSYFLLFYLSYMQLRTTLFEIIFR